MRAELQRAVDCVRRQPVEEANPNRFLDAVLAFLKVLKRFPGGENLLIERGEYISRHTGPATNYASAWERGRDHVPPRCGLLNRDYPKLESKDELAEVSDRIARLLAAEENMARRHPWHERLRAWQREANRLLADVGAWPWDGCYLLLGLYRHDEHCLEAAFVAEIAGEIVEAVGYLADALAADAPARGEGRLAESQPAAPDPQSDWTPPANALEVLLGDSGDILRVARSDKSADDKMREICGIDHRYLGYTSAKWASLLGVTEGAIRKTAFWKKDRSKAKEAE